MGVFMCWEDWRVSIFFTIKKQTQMKQIKLLFFVALLGMSSSAFAQAVSINNYSDFTATITMYAYAPTDCYPVATHLCDNTFIGNPITLTCAACPTPTFYAADPCSFYTTPSWLSTTCSSSWCPTAWPASFQWTFAYVSLNNGCYLMPALSVNIGDGCASTSPSSAPPLLGCTMSSYATWYRDAVTGDVTINIYN